jgi:hypothetical protein
MERDPHDGEDVFQPPQLPEEATCSQSPRKGSDVVIVMNSHVSTQHPLPEFHGPVASKGGLGTPFNGVMGQNGFLEELQKLLKKTVGVPIP